VRNSLRALASCPGATTRAMQDAGRKRRPDRSDFGTQRYGRARAPPRSAHWSDYGLVPSRGPKAPARAAGVRRSDGLAGARPPEVARGQARVSADPGRGPHVRFDADVRRDRAKRRSRAAARRPGVARGNREVLRRAAVPHRAGIRRSVRTQLPHAKKGDGECRPLRVPVPPAHDGHQRSKSNLPSPAAASAAADVPASSR